MIITCEKCTTNYLVPDAAISAEGRNVKCANCAHVWHVMPATADASPKIEFTAPPEKTAPIPEGSSLPAVVDKPMSLKWLFVPFIITLLLIPTVFLLYTERVTRIIPMLKPYALKAGIIGETGVVLTDFSINKEQEGNQTNVLIQGKIANTSSEEKKLPSIRLTLIDNQKSKIISHVLEKDEKILKPGEIYPINNRITNLIKSAEFILIDIGNKKDFFFR